MTKIDLLTGFLGSGKTTFLKGYANYCISKGERICILEFDYGAVNVDMMLLQEFNDICDLEMVAGGCEYDCHVRRFKTKLISMGMKKYDRVIVEPSGIFDPDEFFDNLYDEPLDQWYEIGSIISVVDAGLTNLSQESEYLLLSQIAPAGNIIISKTQNYQKNEIDNTVSYLSRIMIKNNLSLDKNIVLIKPFFNYSSNDYEKIQKAAFKEVSIPKKNVISSNSYNTLYFLNKGFSIDYLNQVVNSLLEDETFGNILRIKGFVNDNGWYEFNYTKNEHNFNNISIGQDVIIVIGENLNEYGIRKILGE